MDPGIGAPGAALNSGGTGPLIASMQPGAPLAASLARQPQDFAGALGPGYPFLPVPLDELGPDGRPKPRKYLYDVATNLNINAKLAQWNVLATAAVQVDIFARAITVRQGDVTKMDWSWNPSKDAINQIMEDNHIGNAEAAKIARTTLMPLINKLPSSGRTPTPSPTGPGRSGSPRPCGRSWSTTAGVRTRRSPWAGRTWAGTSSTPPPSRYFSTTMATSRAHPTRRSNRSSTASRRGVHRERRQEHHELPRRRVQRL